MKQKTKPAVSTPITVSSEQLYAMWPVYAYGRVHAPTVPKGQYTAWISAGGQNDAVVCHAPTAKAVLALRRHILQEQDPVTLHFVFGEMEARSVEDGRVTQNVVDACCSYTFASTKEADAFREGVEAASGWLDHCEIVATDPVGKRILRMKKASAKPKAP